LPWQTIFRIRDSALCPTSLLPRPFYSLPLSFSPPSTLSALLQHS